VATQPQGHVGLQRRRQARGDEEIDPSLLTELAFLTRDTDAARDLASFVDRGLHERHTERAALDAESVLQTFWVKAVEHKQDARRGTALQRGQDGIHLMSEERDENEIVRDFLVQGVGDAYFGPVATIIDDPVVVSEPAEPLGIRPGNRRDIMLPDTSELKSHRASDAAETDYRDP
jgi:hypothetical protein